MFDKENPLISKSFKKNIVQLLVNINLQDNAKQIIFDFNNDNFEQKKAKIHQYSILN